MIFCSSTLVIHVGWDNEWRPIKKYDKIWICFSEWSSCLPPSPLVSTGMGRALLEMRGDLRAPLRVEEEAVWMCQARAGATRPGNRGNEPPPSPSPHLSTLPPSSWSSWSTSCSLSYIHLIPDPGPQVYSFLNHLILMVLVMLKTLNFYEATMSVEQNHGNEPQTMSKPADHTYLHLHPHWYKRSPIHSRNIPRWPWAQHLAWG